MIPLQGERNLDAPKLPALPAWKPYQDRLPTDLEINDWFGLKQYAAIGIVLGRVSGLVVLDIDAPEQAELFKALYPDLVETFTVVSGNRRLPHYYYRIPRGLDVPSRHGQGVELRSNGQYVVAPGTVVDGRSWDVVCTLPPRYLTQSDLSRILAFMMVRSRKSLLEGGHAHVDRFSSPASAVLSECTPELTPDRLVRRYQRLAVQSGRNNALFAAACYARDCGWLRQQVESVLLPVHVRQMPVGVHRPERLAQREHEALRTIASVYTRSPRSCQIVKRNRQLPNAVRERLLGMGLVNVARLLDALLIVGVQPGRALTAKSVYQMVGLMGIGRNTVFGALKAALPEGQRVFELDLSSSPLHPPSPTANAAKRSALITKQCLFGRVATPGKIPGRRERVYQMPEISRLCQAMGVEDQGGDSLQPEDLKSPGTYRAALHAALIRRSPGQYPRHWQAQRLGVSEDSCRRYDRRMGIQVTPMYKRWVVTWQNINQVICEEPFDGTFIEDDTGKRYPPLPAVARKLLAQNRAVTFCWQDANHYHFSPVPGQKAGFHMLPGPESKENGTVARKAVRPARADRTVPHAVEKFCVTPALSMKGTPKSQTTLPRTAATFAFSPDPAREPLILRHSDAICLPLSTPSQRDSYPVQTDSHEIASCKDMLYKQLRELNPQKSMTRKKAAELVERYGVDRVKRGLRVVLGRRNLRNPAGFLVVWLRCEDPSVKLPTRSRHKRSTPGVDDWLDRLKRSPYARFFENAEDLQGEMVLAQNNSPG